MPEEDRERAMKALHAIERELKVAKQKIHDDEVHGGSDKRRHGSLSKLFSKTRPAFPNDETTPANPDAASPNDAVLTWANDFEKLSLQRHRRASVTKKAEYVLFEKRKLGNPLSNIRELAEELRSCSRRHERR